MDYDFPGNVRELENIIERGVALETSNIILPESLELSSNRQRDNTPGLGQSPLFVAAYDEQELFERGMDDVVVNLEKKLLQHALEKTGHSKKKAADLLKITFRSLRYKTKKYGLD